MKYSFSAALRDALIATVMTAIVVTPIFSLHLERAGVRTIITPDWSMTGWACLAIFVVQMLKPLLAGKLPKVNLPAVPQMKSGTRNVVIFVVLMMAASWPFFAGRNAVDIATLAMIYVMLGLGLNVVVGFAGLLDLGFVGFYAVGAYTYALLFHWAGWTFWEALPLAGAASALFGFVLGLPMTRSPLTEDGTTFHQFFGLEFNSMHMVIFVYLMALLLAMVTLFISNRLIRMPIGRAWEALREDEIACRSLGLNPMKIKLSAFTLGAMFAGFGGAFFAARQGIVNPESFTFIESALILAIVVLGGMGSQLGVIVAAIILTVLPELAREFSEYRMLIFGLVMILMMVWRPQGLLPMKRHQVEVKS